MIEHIIRFHMYFGNGDRVYYLNVQNISFKWFAEILRALPMRYYIKPFGYCFGIRLSFYIAKQQAVWMKDAFQFIQIAFITAFKIIFFQRLRNGSFVCLLSC